MRVQVVGWAVVAVGTIAFVLFWVSMESTTCYDAVVASESRCVTEPALGVDGSVLMGVLGALVVAFAVFRAVRAVRSSRAEPGVSGAGASQGSAPLP